jgi:RHS repeat-associated protein
VRYVRDAKGRVQQVRTRASSAVTAWTNIVTNISHLTYGYDNEDNITRITDRLDAANNLSFAYDPNGRLKRVTTASGAMRRTDYVFDANGNRVRVLTRVLPDDPPTSALTERYQYTAGSNQLASIRAPAASGSTGAILRSFTHDARGNLESETRTPGSGSGAGGGVSVATGYDGYGRLINYSRTGETGQSHIYNGMDDRVATTAGASTRRFVYAPDGRVLGEYGNSATDVRAEYIWLNPEVGEAGAFGGDDGLGGYMPLAVAANDNAGTSQLIWVHPSHMGVPIRYSDAGGNMVTRGDWQAPGFPGQSQTHSDLYYNRYRDYDPSTGRYIQADPIGLAGGPSPYSYALNNPLRYSDPQGLCLWDGCIVEGIVVGAVIGAGSDLAIQAASNWWNGRDVLDTDCYDWRQVAIAGGLGGLTGGAGSWLSRGANVAKAAATGGRELVPVGAAPLGAWGEARLGQIVAGGVKPRSPYSTPAGKRYLDRLLDGIGYESKAGLNVGLNSTIEKQIAKDAFLIENNLLKGAEWHFWRGAQPELLQSLQNAGIKTVVH